MLKTLHIIYLKNQVQWNQTNMPYDKTTTAKDKFLLRKYKLNCPLILGLMNYCLLKSLYEQNR